MPILSFDAQMGFVFLRVVEELLDLGRVLSFDAQMGFVFLRVLEELSDLGRVPWRFLCVEAIFPHTSQHFFFLAD